MVQSDQANDEFRYRVRHFSLQQLMLLVFNIACFISFTRFAYISATGKSSSLDLILGVVGLVIFPIGVGMLNRGSFVTMVFSFVLGVMSCLLVRFLACGQIF